MFSTGTVLSERFRLEGPPIGAGSTVEVWPATELATGRAVVVKALHRHLVGPGEIGAAANRASAAIGHAGPAGVAVLGVFSGDGRWWLVAERVEGAPLDAAEALPPRQALALALGVAEELARWHRRGRAHGGVRPGRVLLAERGPRLGEPGFGRSPRAGHDAPELLGGAAPTPRSDVYGLGLVLYRALTGRAPYAGPTPYAVAAAQRAGPPPPAIAPLGLSSLVSKLLDPDPTARPRDAAVVVVALRRLRADPTAPVGLRSSWFPPVRIGAAWSVTGTDPATGAPARMASGLGGRAAARLAARLHAEGWSVVAARDAWGAADLAWITSAVLVGGVLLSAPGALAGLVAAWTWRVGLVRTERASALPRVSVPLPPLVPAPGAEEAITAGLLLLGAAVALLFSPWVAAGMVLAVAGLAVWTLRRPVAAPEDRLATARLEMVLLDARRLLEQRSLPLDRALGLEGELWEIERGWRRGRVDVDHAIARAEILRHRVDRGDPAP